MPGATRCHPPALPTNRIGYLHAGSLSLVASPSLPLLLPDSRFSFRLPFSPSSTYRSHRTHAPSAFNLLFHRIGAVAAGGGGGTSSFETSVALSNVILGVIPHVFLGKFRGNDEAASQPNEIRRRFVGK